MIKRIIGFMNPTYLNLKLGQVVVTYPEIENCENLSDAIKAESVRTIPIEDIGVIILDHKQITITNALMAALLDNNVAIITCNDQHLPIGLTLLLEGNHIQSERFRQQIDSSEPLRKQMWQQTIISKITAQAKLLGKQGVVNGNMLAWSKQVKSGDTDNLEGRAAAYYWRNLFRNPDFIRGREGEPPNNLLNYGYAIVRALMARALVAAGLLPTLGIHHHNRYNAYCLADDIMEPYRPFVDELVIDIMQRFTDISQLTTDIKRDLLGITTVDVIIDNHRSPLQIAIQTTANSVQKCFTGEARKIIYPEW